LQVLTKAAVRSYQKVRLVGNNVNELVTPDEALGRAEEAGMDLVLVNDDCDPPVVRIQDYKKIQYEKKKSRKPTKKISLKEVQFKANISDHDFETKLNSIRRFLERGDKVKIVVRLKGRERDNPERAEMIIDRVGKSVECKMSKVPGPMAIAILEPGAHK
jgi:translation initiation factor IF-3